MTARAKTKAGVPTQNRSASASKGNRRRSARHRYARRGGRRSGTTMWIVLGTVVVVAVALVVATVAQRGEDGGTRSPVSATVMRQLTSVPDAVFDKVGVGSAAAPHVISSPALTKDGKPLVVFMGAEYCPYCAAERWALVIALSRFGTFSGLSTTHSATQDVFPDTATFSLHGATYSSPYLALESVELESNQLAGGTYAKLDTPTAEQTRLMATYDAPPYVAESSRGAIPFIDLGGKYLISGATYDPSTLQGKTAAQIAALLDDPTSASTLGILGSANQITAALCNLTGNQPATACSSAAVKQIQQQLH
jgi:Domain of unknown function (DUF929)